MFFLLDTRWHRNFFYIFFIPPFLLLTHRETIKAVTRSALWRLSVAYLAYLWLTVVWTADATWLDYLGELRRLLCVVLFITFTSYLAAEYSTFIPRLLLWLSWTAGVTAAGAIVYHLWRHGFWTAQLEGFGRTGQPTIGAAIYGAVGLGIYYYLIPRSPSLGVKSGYWIVLLVLLAFMVLTQSRGPLLAVGVTLILGGIVTKNGRLVLVLSLPAVAYAALAAIDAIEIAEWILRRGWQHRLEIWQQTAQQIGENFWIGVGTATGHVFVMSDGMRFRSPHNIFLANHYYGGVVATVLLSSLIGISLVRAYRGWRRGGTPLCLSLLVFGLTCSLFDTRTLLVNVNEDWIKFWLPVALLTGLGITNQPSERLDSTG